VVKPGGRVLLAGAGGQFGKAWATLAPPGWTVVGLGRAELDIADAAAVDAAVRAAAPDLVVNGAAYTAVDRAESEPDAAFRANRDGARHLAQASRAAGGSFVTLSTDFVFDGETNRPYRPEDPTRPLGVYGASKAAGEEAVLAADPDALIVRTAWVYAATGANFLNTMLRLMAEREVVRVVADQVGAPTSAATLADAVWRLVELRAGGIFHVTDAGVASWYDFAQAIAEEALATGRLASPARVEPIATADYPTPARRPGYSVLDKSATWALLGRTAPHWRVALRATLAEADRLALR